MSETASALLRETEMAQGAASDPEVSAWVAANAGAGKTHVLKMRVLRLLLAGTEPGLILCLTYTKAAAAEMSARIFAELSQWATASAGELEKALTALLQRAPNQGEREMARRLFAAAIETPGGLKIQTIHAFCERLLQRFPLEAGVPPGFKILDDETGRTLLGEAIEEMLTAATRQPGSQLGLALQTAVRFAAGDSFDELLGAAIMQRDWLEQMLLLELSNDADELDAAHKVYRKLLGLTPDDDAEAITAELAAMIPDAELQRIARVLDTGTANDLKAAALARAVIDAPAGLSRIEALGTLLLNSKGEPRARFMTNRLAAEFADIEEYVQRTTTRFVALDNKRRSFLLLDATLAIIRLAADVRQRFAEAKALRAALDFEDLIRRAVQLLSTADSTAWVLYKLDGGLKHILVDEAQDTSPHQWAIIEALAAEFFSGAGASEGKRTLFAVGDEKQSIYSFQGAAPKMFAATGARFQAMCRQAGMEWRHLPLHLSFRTIAALLEGVDLVFNDPGRAAGIQSETTAIRHTALRQGQAGLIEMWPVEQAAPASDADPWSPLGDSVETAPAVRVAERIAATIDHWLQTGERLVSENRPIHAGDILILVRSRRPFAGAMVTALKARNIPVAGADRMQLTDQIAVQDLIALGEFLSLPEDDLSLACVLKSPLFDLDDDDLLKIAPGRKSTLWSALIDKSKSDDRFRPAAALLKRWRSDADYLPPFEFFSKILDSDHMRARLLRRLGPDAADPIDEFLNRAIAYDEQHPPSMLGFLCWLRAGIHEVKRDMEQTRREVRVMTVHGAKGLEAPILFLPDTCSASSKTGGLKLLAMSEDRLPDDFAPPFLWPVKGTSTLDVVREAKESAKRAAGGEHKRLLYVALTRPRDRLYIAGYQGRKRRPSNCWYDLIEQGLSGVVKPVQTAQGSVLRYEAAQTAPHEKSKAEAAGKAAMQPLPEWAKRQAPRETTLVMPLAPSRLAPLETDDAGEPVAVEPQPAVSAAADVGAPSPLTLAAGNRFLRGTLTHALLEHLPLLPVESWDLAAAKFLEVRARTLDQRMRTSIAAETLAVLRDARFAEVFGPSSKAEVPIVGEIANKDPRRPKLRIFGQIDRLAKTDHAIMIVDYKTNRPPPQDVAGIPVAYLLQMASYRLVLKTIYKDLPVQAAILWTDGPRLMPIPDEVLDAHTARLWELGSSRLDG